jgi:hypothetical protein
MTTTKISGDVYMPFFWHRVLVAAIKAIESIMLLNKSAWLFWQIGQIGVHFCCFIQERVTLVTHSFGSVNTLYKIGENSLFYAINNNNEEEKI